MNETALSGDLNATATCPQCGARRVGSVEWCTQCYHRFEPVAMAPTVPHQPAGTASEPADPQATTQQEGEADDLLGERTALDDKLRNPERDLAESEARAQEMLAELAASAGRPVQGRWSALSEFAGTHGGKVALMIGGSMVLLAVGFGLMSLIGLAL